MFSNSTFLILYTLRTTLLNDFTLSIKQKQISEYNNERQKFIIKYLQSNYKYLPEDLRDYYNKHKKDNILLTNNPYFYKDWRGDVFLRKVFIKKITKNKRLEEQKKVYLLNLEPLTTKVIQNFL